MKVSVFCSLSVEGLHRWERCDVQETAYLAAVHRHVFKIVCWGKVRHDDRDIEFIKLKHDVLKWLHEKYWSDAISLHDFGGLSCEAIAIDILRQFSLCKVLVSEDEENGAEVSEE